jgi:hypothetical protein
MFNRNTGNRHTDRPKGVLTAVSSAAPSMKPTMPAAPAAGVLGIMLSIGPREMKPDGLSVTRDVRDDALPHELPAMDQQPGWFWRTPEGRVLLRSITPDLLDDPEIGNQREED